MPAEEIALPPALQALKDRIVAERGYWHPFHEGLLQHDPDFLDAYLSFLSQPWKTGLLEPKVREFIYIAVDAAVSHMYERGMRRHIEFALDKGATAGEVLEVVQLTAGLGGESAVLGVRILAEELKAARGEDVTQEPLSDDQHRLKQEFVAVMGHWPAYGDAFLALDPAYLRSFLKFVGGPWQRGTLTPKVKDFIAIAVNVSPSTLNEAGVRRHIRSALGHGASAGEIMEVIQLAAAIAIHSCTIGVPNLVEAANERSA